MSLIEHARYELDRIKCDEPEKSALLAAVEGFAQGGWSDGSASRGVATLVRLLRFQPLSPLTSDTSEWQLVQDGGDENVWQSRRRATTFSRDGGRTWYDVEDEALNHGDVWVRAQARWEPLVLGDNAQVGARVRVRLDAYDADTANAHRHNGRDGELVLVDSGRCTVRYADGREFRHEPARLEVLKAAP